MQAYHQYGVGWRPACLLTKKGALDSHPQVIKFTSYLPMVGGSHRLLPPLKLIAIILLKVVLKHQKSSSNHKASSLAKGYDPLLLWREEEWIVTLDQRR